MNDSLNALCYMKNTIVGEKDNHVVQILNTSKIRSSFPLFVVNQLNIKVIWQISTQAHTYTHCDAVYLVFPVGSFGFVTEH